jgi:large subunit ribosomal protein L4
MLETTKRGGREMPKVDLYNKNGEIVGDLELSDNVFGIEVNENAMHLAVVNQLANMRQGTHFTKTISEVRGGGAKPWRQKGTGRARHGSIRAAQWTKGGIAHGPRPRDYSYSIPKKVKRLALKSALSSKVIDNDIIVVEDLKFDSIKTKQVNEVLKNLKTGNDSVLFVLEAKDDVLQKSARNIPSTKTVIYNTLNVYDILKYRKFIATKDAIKKIEEVYA